MTIAAALTATPLDRLLEEALALAEETRDELATDRLPGDRRSLEATLELSRITTRLLHAIAFLLMRKAALAGETAVVERIGVDPSPDWEAERPSPRLDPTTRALAERSRALYLRLARLAAH